MPNVRLISLVFATGVPLLAVGATSVTVAALLPGAGSVQSAATQPGGQPQAPPGPAADLLKEGQQKLREGQHVEALALYRKAIFDKGTNPDQAPFVPYLVGYVAFYTGDYQTALAELQKGNQNDPFILALIAQTYEKLGDQAQATEYYRRALRSNAHNPTGAYARPLARQRLGEK